MFFDSYAWLEYLSGSAAGERVRTLMDQVAVIHTAPIVLAEVYSKLARTVGAEDATQVVEHILKRSAVTIADEEIGVAAGMIHAQEKQRQPTFGMADAFVLASARARSVRIVTGDPHFKDMEDAIML